VLIGRVNISPVARRTFTVRYPWLRTGERLLDATATVTPADSLFTVTNVSVIGDGTVMEFTVDGGDATLGDEYKTTVLVSTDQGQINDDCIIFTIDCGGCC